MNSVSHSRGNCKHICSVSENFSAYALVDNQLCDHRLSPPLRMELFNRIMSGSNEQALAILDAVGFDAAIPGTEFSITGNDVVEFYNVDPGVLKSLLYRKDFTTVKYPCDIRVMSVNDIIKSGVPLVRREEDYRRALYFRQGEPDRVFSFPTAANKSLRLFTPRAVLAIAILLLYTDKTDTNSGPIKRTLLAIKSSSYRVSQPPALPAPAVSEELVEPATEAAEAIVKSAESGVPTITLNPEGQLVLSPEAFKALLYPLVSAAAAAAVSAMKEAQ